MKIIIDTPNGFVDVAYKDLITDIKFDGKKAICEYRGNVLPPNAELLIETP